MADLKLIDRKQPVSLSVLIEIETLLNNIAKKDVSALAVVYVDRETGDSNSFAFNHSHESAMAIIREMRNLENRLL